MGLAGQDPLQPCGDVGVVVEAEHRVGLGQALREVGAVPLGQTAHRDDRLRAAGLLEVGGREQRVDGVLLGLLDEPAGVHDDGVRVGRVCDEGEPARRQPARQLLGVDLVAGAAQGHERDGVGHRALSMTRASLDVGITGPPGIPTPSDAHDRRITIPKVREASLDHGWP